MGLITISIVFLALSGIALIIYGVKFLVPLVETVSQKPEAPVEGAQVVRKEIVPSASSGARPLHEDVEAEVVAAIAGAVAVLTGGRGEVVSVRPAAPAASRGGTAWKLAGRMDGLEGF
jgi:hypothetical protein